MLNQKRKNLALFLKGDLSMTNNSSENLIFSKLSGRNFYVIDDVYENSNKISAHHFIDTDVYVDIKVIKAKNTDTETWRSYIVQPPDSNIFRWPIDIVEVKDTIFAEKGNIGIVFLKRGFPALKQLKELIYDDSQLDWTNSNTQLLIKNFLASLSLLEKQGYSFISFNIEKIFYDPTNYKLFFDFSPSTLKLTSINIEKKYSFLDNDISIDFIPPWVDYDKINKVNKKFGYYSVASLLFRLMIGRMPYQGSLLDGCGQIMNNLMDTDPKQHFDRMREYLQTPIFIFDKNDTSNSIGEFGDEKKYIERWSGLADELKIMFDSTFNDNKSKEEPSLLFSINQWIEAVNNCF